MRVYVAAPLGEVETARDVAEHLKLAGHGVVSRWVYQVDVGDCDPDDEDTRSRVLADNLVDLAQAEAIVAWTAAGRPRATYGEIAFALALGHRVVWIHSLTGYGRCLFDAHSCVTRLPMSPLHIDYAAIDAALKNVDAELKYLRARQSSYPPARLGT